MVRLATVHDYPAVSNLLATCSKYPEAYSELSTWLLSATSKISCFSSMKIAVVVDKFQRIVGCMLMDDAPYFLHTKQICIAERMNARLMLQHMYEFLQQFAYGKGYLGISLTVEESAYSDILNSFESPSLNYINCSMNISDLKSMPTDEHIRAMKPTDITQLCDRRNALTEFAEIEQKTLIEINKQDSASLVSLLEKYCGISEDTFKKSLMNHKTMTECITKMTKPEVFFKEFFSEKLVYVDDNNQIAGYIMFRTGDQFKHCVEITDFFIRAKYTNTDIPIKLCLSAGKYAAVHGARVICGSCARQTPHNYIHKYYKKAGLLTYSTTFIYAFSEQNNDAVGDTEEKTFLFG